MVTGYEATNRQPEKFQENLEAILARQLTPETIDTYASDALDDLIELTTRVTAAYSQQPVIQSGNATELEDFAFTYFDLGSLEDSLDNVADLSATIDSLDEVIKSATITNNIVIPPDYTEVTVLRGNGSFKEKNIYARVKTTLFILEHDFGIDIHNPERRLLTTGGTEGIMRDASYYLMDVPELQRAILVCDEEGNVSYVFDSRMLEELGKSPSDLIELPKNSLNELIDRYPGIGKRIVYSKHFIPHMKANIEMITSASETDDIEPAEKSDYLREVGQAPEGYRSRRAIATNLKVDPKGISNAIIALENELGEVIRAKFGSKISDAFSPQQQEMIREYLDKRGRLVGQAPEGYLSLKSVAEEYQVSYDLALRAVKALEGELGKVSKAKFFTAIADAYSPVQQDMIGRFFEESGALTDKLPDGYRGVAGLARELRVSRTTIDKAAEALKVALGDVILAKFLARTAVAFSPQQQEMIRQYLEEEGLLAEHLEDHLSLTGMVEELSIGRKILVRAITELGDSLGPVKNGKFGARTAKAYSPAQQRMLVEHIQGNGLYLPLAPEGFASIYSLAREFGVGDSTVLNAVKILEADLGEVTMARFSAVEAKAYSPEQQNQIRDYLQANGVIGNSAPDGYQSVVGITTEMGLSHHAVVRAIKDLGPALGEVRKAKFFNITTDAYSPSQQRMIRERLQEQGFFAEDVPEGYKNIKGIADYLNVAHATVADAIDALRNELGAPIKARFNSSIADAYSPEQQKTIRDYLDGRGLFIEQAPKGYKSLKGMIIALGAAQSTILVAIESLGDDLGKPIRAKFGSIVTDAYSPSQQDMIRTTIESGRLKAR